MSCIGRHHYKNIIDLDDDEENFRDTTLAADRGVYFSNDGRRRNVKLLNVAHKKRRINLSALDNALAEWIPVPEDGFTEDKARVPPPKPANSDESTLLGKRKEYISTKDPMSLFRPLSGFFLDEVIRHAGLGDDLDNPCCAQCEAPFDMSNPTGLRAFKCYQCEGCCIAHHQRTPLHVIKEWNGTFWVACILEQLGLIYQLGHGGFPCPFPDETAHKMTLIEAPMIHQITMRYCKCEKSDDADNLEQLLRNKWFPATVTDPGTCATFLSLEAYRLYNIVGNLNVRDFITALERVTDTTVTSGMTWLPRMARQWAFIKRLQRAGRGHDVTGVDSTKLAVDANFRLKNRKRKNEIDDPSLGPGWGYWVEPQQYRKHLKKYVNEKDTSTCIAFAALLQKDTRLTTGLRVSGVGGCVCARHECMRPNGLGDLQKGERYANMDYIVMAALAGFSLMLLTISYDIACQWKVHLAERTAKLPLEMCLPLNDIKLQYALPVWHAGSHNEDCRDANSLSFKPGVGKSDGEGVERTWSVLNPAAHSTKDAGRGQRADTLEGKIDNHNYLKTWDKRKLIVAIAERDKQVHAFAEVNKTVDSSVKKMWKDLIDAWLEDESKPNPYTLNHKDCPTETQCTAFLVAGIQIEDAQRRIIAERKVRVLVAADRENKIEEWRHALLVKISKFRTLQNIYMPGAARAIADAEAAWDQDESPPKPEHIQLFMPSDLAVNDVNEVLRACVPGLVGMEAKLRVGQCDNSLVSLRARLHAKRFLIGFRNENVAGQVQATKARTLIGQVGERAESYAERYRKGHRALVFLKGTEAYPYLRELKADNIQLDGDWGDSDAQARKKQAMIGVGRGAREPRNAPGTSKWVMSWIWTARAIRVEWVRARARKIRWTEEVMILREEMRRVIRYLGWQVTWWQERVNTWPDAAPSVQAGARAYTMKQAAWHERLAGFFQTKWNLSAPSTAQQLMELDTFFDEQ
ncbi:hypothetical protein B0H13DRAFT_1914961 [Mycena leptocephala]|nr:hypothetical protein B0H13DRAFT_1914961 [Mycena leptocephala]